MDTSAESPTLQPKSTNGPKIDSSRVRAAVKATIQDHSHVDPYQAGYDEGFRDGVDSTHSIAACVVGMFAGALGTYIVLAAIHLL